MVNFNVSDAMPKFKSGFMTNKKGPYSNFLGCTIILNVGNTIKLNNTQDIGNFTDYRKV